MLDTILIVVVHLLMTLPSAIYHGCINLYNYFMSDPLSNKPLRNENLIVLVPGRGGVYTQFLPLIHNIKKGKVEHKIRMVNIGNTKNTSIDTDVDRLKSELEIYPDCKIILVGLSKGGVVVSRYVTTIEDNRIKKIITISSPLRGTKIASLLPEKSITRKELQYGSEFVKNMMVSEFPVPMYHIVPLWDHLIIPTKSAAYPFSDSRNIHYYNGFYSHFGITHSIEVADAIIKWIS